ncbi:endonuclease/exonuclease/phosphatase family protein [Geoalkalibacter halelectricus]|uniref:Endonuclease/exonuclease/phosphatase family protein n=1 Tax=Geoalkalibacter halelectricus TaxID=2847045 RepID=A0ABY5ZFR7_9BACT|nr:endonuclease/exonuclease/phosphatase family protein [Geoalkalibacter halelectricus]MDO3378171.1 endonuclease/exonuclease/phosphatase family protein [Geoalkalibacter halelectricus]UWZ78017.1 endonuclease/exonuclease/phosphatase family protein [Geoalkalibacter halelectricus]
MSAENQSVDASWPVVRLACYNIHQGVGRDGRRDLERVARVIRSLRADVVVVQELHVFYGSSEERHQLEDLAAATGMVGISGPTLLRPDGHYGNAVLVRVPVARQRLHDLSHPGREPRGLVEVELDTAIGPLKLLATHLGLLPRERRGQVRRILELVETSPRPLVLAGDFNEWWPWGRPARWLGRAFPGMPAPATFPARFPLLALDRILVDPPQVLRSLEVVREGDVALASDHLPLLAELALPP